MATYHGYITVPHSSYEVWKSNTLGNSYDVDYYPAYAPFQCWDYCALLWRQYGLTLITKAGGGGAIDCWRVSRYVNARTPFISLTGASGIKKGDILVFKPYSGWVGVNGHIGLAATDYSGRNVSQNLIKVLGQNQAGSSKVNIVEYPLAALEGYFRNTYWTESPTPEPTPTPSDTTKRDKFPWAIAWRHWPNFKR